MGDLKKVVRSNSLRHGKKVQSKYQTFCSLSLNPGRLSHRVISYKVHRLFFKLSYFRPDRFVQLPTLIPFLTLLLYFLVSKDLARLEERKSNC